jgi:membrane-bound lytic murein transglycosylase F
MQDTMIRITTKWSLIGVWLLVGLWITGCDRPLFLNDLEAIKARGELIFITRNNSICYYEGPQGPAGFEYDLAKGFADYLGVNLRPLVIEDEAEMITALRNGQADLIAAGTPFGKQPARFLALGPGYLEVKQVVVGRRGGAEVNDIQSLSDSSIWITSNSARIEALNALKIKNANLSWQTLSDYSTEELLQMVWNRSLPLTVVDSNTLAMNRRYYPELVAHFDVGNPIKLAWAIHPQNRQLQREVVHWFSQADTQNLVQGLKDYYFSHLEDFDYVDLARYRRRIRLRLPKYQVHFKEAARQYGLDWQLVAAQAYQESHWNPRAKSFTGVRGIMMLTRETAKILGLKNRLEAKESIFAGAQYLAKLHQMIGDQVSEPDRMLMALAAYNLGLGHLQDARTLAARMGKPDNTWHGVRTVLPLLQKKKYYSSLPNGYARGTEAVQYVDRIRTYHKVLIMALLPDGSFGIGG